MTELNLTIKDRLSVFTTNIICSPVLHNNENDTENDDDYCADEGVEA